MDTAPNTVPNTASHTASDAGAEQQARRRAIGAFAAADLALLEAAWDGWPQPPAWTWLRRPECGLVMVRGRVGGGGAPFNLGEATVTRCALALDSGEAGFSWILGGDARKARLAALFDALWQRGEHRLRVEADVVAPALAAREAGDSETAGRTAATRVDFFTLVRGEDEP